MRVTLAVQAVSAGNVQQYFGTRATNGDPNHSVLDHSLPGFDSAAHMTRRANIQGSRILLTLVEIPSQRPGHLASFLLPSHVALIAADDDATHESLHGPTKKHRRFGGVALTLSLSFRS